MENNINEQDLQMAQYIWNVLNEKKAILWSWGFDNVQAIKLGIKFDVDGLRLKGSVEIVYDHPSDSFDIYLYGKDEKLKEVIERVYFYELTDMIDERVEKVGNYEEKVEEYLKTEI